MTNSVVCPDANYNEDYNGEIGRRLIERVHEHSDKDVNSHLFKHSIQTDHPTVTIDDFRILKTGYRQKMFRKKLSQYLFYEQNKPALNKQEAFIPLKSFN